MWQINSLLTRYEGISNFRISGQSPIKENCNNSSTSDDVNIKLRPATKLDKKNKIPFKKIEDDVMLVNYDVLVIFPIYAQFGAIWKPGCECIVYKTYFH